MEEIIKQIAQIDSVAASNRKNSEQALKEKRHQYEEEIRLYRESSLKRANEKAKEIYKEIVSLGESGNQVEAQKCKQDTQAVVQHYEASEKKLLEEVLSELFKIKS